MSNSQRSIVDLLALEDSCRTCGAQRGEWCRIRPGYRLEGKPAQYLHVERTRATYHARWVGYTEGQLDMVRMIAHRHNAGEDLVHLLAEQEQRVERWAQSAHQRALEDIPEGWRR